MAKKSERRQDQSFSWLRGDKGAPSEKKNSSAGSDRQPCPITGSYDECPTGDVTKGCSGC